MNNYKKISIALFIVALVLIVTGNSILVYQTVSKNGYNKEELQKNLTASLNNFKKKADDFSNVREEYSDNVESSIFVETIDEYDNWIKEIDNYTEMVEDIDKSSEYLKKVCLNHYYSEQEIKNKCDAFIVAYETMINYYVQDINSFNNNLDEISKELNKKLSGYNLKYDFTDINSDGKYIGME